MVLHIAPTCRLHPTLACLPNNQAATFAAAVAEQRVSTPAQPKLFRLDAIWAVQALLQQ